VLHCVVMMPLYCVAAALDCIAVGLTVIVRLDYSLLIVDIIVIVRFIATLQLPCYELDDIVVDITVLPAVAIYCYGCAGYITLPVVVDIGYCAVTGCCYGRLFTGYVGFAHVVVITDFGCLTLLTCTPPLWVLDGPTLLMYSVNKLPIIVLLWVHGGSVNTANHHHIYAAFL